MEMNYDENVRLFLQTIALYITIYTLKAYTLLDAAPARRGATCINCTWDRNHGGRWNPSICQVFWALAPCVSAAAFG